MVQRAADLLNPGASAMAGHKNISFHGFQPHAGHGLNLRLRLPVAGEVQLGIRFQSLAKKGPSVLIQILPRGEQRWYIRTEYLRSFGEELHAALAARFPDQKPRYVSHGSQSTPHWVLSEAGLGPVGGWGPQSLSAAGAELFGVLLAVLPFEEASTSAT